MAKLLTSSIGPVFLIAVMLLAAAVTAVLFQWLGMFPALMSTVFGTGSIISLILTVTPEG